MKKKETTTFSTPFPPCVTEKLQHHGILVVILFLQPTGFVAGSTAARTVSLLWRRRLRLRLPADAILLLIRLLHVRRLVVLLSILLLLLLLLVLLVLLVGTRLRRWSGK